jgi:hypothetical protein
MKKLQGLSFLAITLALSFVFIGCPGTGSPPPADADKDALIAAISAANSAKEGVVVDTAAANVEFGTKWVEQSVMNTFTEAITAAEAVKNNGSATQNQVDTAENMLVDAKDTFIAIRDGIGHSGTKVTKDALIAAIAAANETKNILVVATMASEVPIGTKWVLVGDKNTYQTAINTAQTVVDNANADQAGIDSAIATLATATTDFTDAQYDGEGEDIILADKTELLTALNAANTAKSGVTTNFATNPDDVSPGVKYVLEDVLTTLNNAITAAQTVYDTLSAAQDAVDAQTGTLTTATGTFTSAIETGSDTTTVKGALGSAISSANTNADSVEVAAAAENVYEGTKWVTSGEKLAYTSAIASATGVWSLADKTKNQVIEATGNLATATGIFNAAKKDGTKPPPPTPSGKIYLSDPNSSDGWSKIEFSTVSSGTSGTYKGSKMIWGGDESPPTLLEVAEGTYSWNESNLTVTLTPTKLKINDYGEYDEYLTKDQYKAEVQAQIDAIPARNSNPTVPQLKTFLQAFGAPEEMFYFTSLNQFLTMMSEEFGPVSTWAQFYDVFVSEMIGGTADEAANRKFAPVTYGYSFSNDNEVFFLSMPLPANIGTNQLSGGTFHAIIQEWNGSDEPTESIGQSYWTFTDATHYTVNVKFTSPFKINWL